VVTRTADPKLLWELAATVPDPELPFLTIADLGILRDVACEDGRVVVTVTPTYSGCPATEAIAADISATLTRAGFGDVSVRTELAPAWTTDWITEQGRRKLAEAGIAPPSAVTAASNVVELIRCPRCGSGETRLVSRFGSTACKSLRACKRCLEPFDHFRPF
jgi:ring-1,2-phenylacetyl-CoA epoxidase subunit PaaD